MRVVLRDSGSGVRNVILEYDVFEFVLTRNVLEVLELVILVYSWEAGNNDDDECF